MKTVPSKIEGMGIVNLRCECCFGNIEQDHTVTVLLAKDGIRFIHTSCYFGNTPEYILERMNEIKKKTKEDGELFDLMEESDGKKSNK